MMKPAIVSVVNRKGGVGKTTLAIAIADALVSEHEMPVAIVDLDPQASASRALVSDDVYHEFIRKRAVLYHLLKKRLAGDKPELTKFRKGMVHKIKDRPHVNCDVYLNSDKFWDLEAREVELDGGKRLQRDIGTFLRYLKSMQFERDQGRVVVVDCPPGQSVSALGAIRASDMVLCPITPDRFAIWGKDLLAHYIQKHAKGTVPKFVVSRSQLRGADVKESIQELAQQDQMLMVETGKREHGVYGRLAPFSDRARVKKRIQASKPRTLRYFYQNEGAHELRNIVNAIRRELDDG